MGEQEVDEEVDEEIGEEEEEGLTPLVRLTETGYADVDSGT